ncbi:3-deoxy-D-manno-octulosonate 8-phosphate phosphatase, YrbI family [Tolumonas auensis DSM 9187]|uniref:3-deoxy-D-manno-octulosonate 8-phosphate phosphatase KdsC n=1 Tax=Tolumonas auensis (strain DSM 9187 / NBRC 110442 / TA 4) TaxID=595494 RepID=C4LCZ2_TOLAT|nr:3-deoxy-manno-octulosonate-8-phosphatase KdsC [Tolumonas auensis]ACQ94523.1 3-deoxy-D-manno-octulosonate 8-phosphate phosphatase, YrbI family [Tolumonas auensis DSM 9187]NCB56776.1 3-deoxy-manno-octulosonate-8-phosphatase KdsC [Gammaproteobacteria bacterium]
MSDYIATPYGTVEKRIMALAAEIRLLVCDVDGVLSDGRIYMGNDGEELKTFHTHDGFGIKALLNAGIDVAVITGRSSNIVQRRMQALGVQHIYQGQGDKLPAFEALLDKLELSASQAAYIGDDVIDLPVMHNAALGIAVVNAHPLVLQKADLVTRTSGGYGAVREVCDLILQAHGQLDSAQGTSV